MQKYMLLLIFCGTAFMGSAQTAITKVSTDPQYGFVPEKPVKVGGGPRDQHAYLQQLRDAKGNPVSYERQGSCCRYKTDSPGAPFGFGLLDVYEVTCRNEKNKKKKVNVYITFYDLEEPQILYGFTGSN